MARLGLERAVVDTAVYENTVARFKEAGVLLPTLGQLKDPSTIPAAIKAKLKDVNPDSPHPLNLFRVHWFNDGDRTGLVDIPEHIELPSALTGVKARIVAVEAAECPTLLNNGFGEHNIQGIGDKHVPYIHNVMNTDVVTAVSDLHSDQLLALFNTDEGRKYLVERRGIDAGLVARLSNLGLSSLCNMLAAIKTARYYGLGVDDVILTVATDGAALYTSEIDKTIGRNFCGRFDAINAGEIWGQSLAATTTDLLLEMTHVERKRVFNLGYFTWVEQQGVSLEEFSARASQSFWDGLQELVPAWDAMIAEFNARTGVGKTLGV